MDEWRRKQRRVDEEQVGEVCINDIKVVQARELGKIHGILDGSAIGRRADESQEGTIVRYGRTEHSRERPVKANMVAEQVEVGRGQKHVCHLFSLT